MMFLTQDSDSMLVMKLSPNSVLSTGSAKALVFTEASAKFQSFCQLTEASVITESSKVLQIQILPKLRQKVRQKLLPNHAS